MRERSPNRRPRPAREPAPSEPPETPTLTSGREGAVPEPPPTPGPEPAPSELPEIRRLTSGPPRERSPNRRPSPHAEAAPAAAHWLLSLFAPAPPDAVDWSRGNYTLVARARPHGRGSGELKKTCPNGRGRLGALRLGGAARRRAGCGARTASAHPVFRAGFAVSVPLPEVG